MIPFILIWSAWLLSEVITNRLLRSGPDESKGSDKSSLPILWITIGAAIATGILLVLFLPLPFSRSMLLPLAGLILIVTGMVIRFLAITIRANHRLKTDGMYRFVRHPSYSGSLVSFLGFGLSLNNLLSTLVIMAMVASAFLYRIGIEEQTLLAEFGNEYQVYRKKTYGLIPWVY
jgi:protein-S-isoprenylcysteine O-methyltransferase Ste14